MDEREFSLPPGCGYRIVRCLGRGGGGTVFLVCHLITEQLRAAKILTDVSAGKKHELDMMKHLNHPSLPKIIDVLEQDEDVWLIMEYIHGTRLDQLAAKGLEAKQIWSVARQLCDVLVYLHTRKEPVLHLDVKPSNILIRPDGGLFLIDFGASIRGHPSMETSGKYGTRGFAAPEQFISGKKIDERADLYGFGAVLYYCRFKKIPDKDGSGAVYDRKHRKTRGLDRIIRKCLQSDPDKRYSDSLQLYKAVCRAGKLSKFERGACKSAGAAALLIFTILFLSRRVISLPEKIYREDAGSETSSVQEESGTDTDDFAYGDSETDSGDSIYEEGGDDAVNSVYEEREYHRMLNMAAGSGFVQAAEFYEAAAMLKPADEEWYLQLIERVTADGLFDMEEEAVLKSLIYSVDTASGLALLELLEENPEAYSFVTYRIGLSYWYFYEGTGGKSAAAWWFNEAVTSLEKIPENDAARNPEWIKSAELLANIGSYYGMLARTSLDDDRDEMEWNYWTDLKELWYLYMKQEEEALICCEAAEELLALQILKAYEIRRYGDTEEDMLQLIAGIETFLESDFMEEHAKEKEKLKNQCIDARLAVERAFQEETGGYEE